MSFNTADFDPADFESRESADKSVYVKFYMRPVQDEAKSASEGRPIYTDKEYVEIRTPGNQTNVIQRPVSDMDRQRFRHAYRAFKEGEVEQVTGTPLVEAPWITRSQVEELAHLRIRTMEHLADVGDDVCTRVPGLYTLKDRAKKMMEKSKDAAPVTELQAKNEELRNELEALKITIKEQSEVILALKAAHDAKTAEKGSK